MAGLLRRIVRLGDLFLSRYPASWCIFLGHRYSAPFFGVLSSPKKEPRANVSLQSLGSKPIDNGQSHRAIMLNSFGQLNQTSSTTTKIQLHARIVQAGTTHGTCCRSCQAPCNAFKRQRVWLRTIRFLEFDPTSQSNVIQSVKKTIARFVCTAYQFTWPDYPDFRPTA